jgi:hypothetical protein
MLHSQATAYYLHGLAEDIVRPASGPMFLPLSIHSMKDVFQEGKPATTQAWAIIAGERPLLTRQMLAYSPCQS